MISDWVKMRTDLYRDPKVCLMADFLMSPKGELASFVGQNCQRDMTVTRNVMRNVTVGALVTVWGVTRHRGKRNGNDLLVSGATVSVIDDIADLPGFGAAMLSVGWIEESSKGIVFPNFFADFNVDPAEDAKKKNAERQRRHREKSNVTSNVTVTDKSNTEKRREEKSNTPLPPEGEAGRPNPPDGEYTTDGRNPPPANRGSVTFEAFWAVFTNKENKAGAKKEWKKLVERTSMPESLFQKIMAKLSKFVPVWEARQPDKRPAAVWWIENERWNDPDPPTAQQNAQPQYRPTGSGTRICDEE